MQLTWGAGLLTENFRELRVLRFYEFGRVKSRGGWLAAGRFAAL